MTNGQPRGNNRQTKATAARPHEVKRDSKIEYARQQRQEEAEHIRITKSPHRHRRLMRAAKGKATVRHYRRWHAGENIEKLAKPALIDLAGS